MKFNNIYKMLLVFSLGVINTVYAHELLAGDEGEQEKLSRYKIFTAEHEAVLANGKVVKVNSIFKLDRDTGTVWRYRQGVDSKGKPFEEFFEVPNQ